MGIVMLSREKYLLLLQKFPDVVKIVSTIHVAMHVLSVTTGAHARWLMRVTPVLVNIHQDEINK